MMTDEQRQEFAPETEAKDLRTQESNDTSVDDSGARRKRARIGQATRPVVRQTGSERVNYNQGRQPRTSHSFRPQSVDPFGDTTLSSGQTYQSATPESNYPPRPRQYAQRPPRPYTPGPRGYNRPLDQMRQPERTDARPADDNRPIYPHSPMSKRNSSGERRPMSYRDNGGESGRPYGAQQRMYQQRPRRKIDPNRTNQPPKTIKYQEVLADPNEPIRLNKFLANAGVCSRREADELIKTGQVTVNGQVVTELGTRITRQDTVMSRGVAVSIESKVYVLLNKPKNCVTTSDDPQCRRTVMDLVANACTERIYPVGRLDRNTTGVMLVTNDGDLASKLTHPTFMKKKIYHVWLDRPVAMADMQRIAEGIELEDGEIHADAISYVSEEDLSQVGIEIHSGRNRLVRRIFEHLGYRVHKLDRVYFAGLTKKNLSRGRWRYLNEQEVNSLRMGAFE